MKNSSNHNKLSIDPSIQVTLTLSVATTKLNECGIRPLMYNVVNMRM